ncbi:hypothetical protein P153DRAFT_391197 [Dothidotthia symphoricarpi CBS 119687]|uniref:Uncharacterized protein n=1 Tax=Dothidotthia symphoricarpi CBS 119687 TaxID=1392245 RepID=A0A6A5ZYB4_9PLEO|nr:uncharacterized protein P153DRAFT_391197 [Dothidotthia symphoricarpi CBS 119687]KAF2123777.1 hypothetical protein P153DRAFT_391197 [Dothidotthia symphoricarpi CBS 119687]
MSQTPALIRCRRTTRTYRRCQRLTDHPTHTCWQHDEERKLFNLQCTAATQKGSRCERFAENTSVNQRCWQHLDVGTVPNYPSVTVDFSLQARDGRRSSWMSLEESTVDPLEGSWRRRSGGRSVRAEGQPEASKPTTKKYGYSRIIGTSPLTVIPTSLGSIYGGVQQESR